jgi:hypothetical protein
MALLRRRAGVPGGAVAQHGVEDHQELAHGGSERELVGFAGGAQTLVESADHRVVAAGEKVSGRKGVR